MGLTKCKECGKSVSTTAPSCPNCGAVVQKKSGCGTYFLVVIAMFFIYAILSNAYRGNIKNETSAENNSYKPEIVSDIKWKEINDIYNINKKHTDLQKNEHWKKYKGKVIQWTGTVSEVSEGIMGSSLNLQIKMNRDTFASDLLVSLHERERDKAMKLKQGDKVTFQGELLSWGSLLPITITNGKIIK